MTHPLNQNQNGSVQEQECVGQCQGTQSWTIINRVHNHAHNFTEKYYAARAAKYQLVGGGAWEQSLKILLDSDIQSYSDASLKPQQGCQRGTLEDDEQEALERVEGSRMETSVAEEEDGINLLPQAQAKRDRTGAT